MNYLGGSSNLIEAEVESDHTIDFKKLNVIE
jgi:hypothetical protein